MRKWPGFTAEMSLNGTSKQCNFSSDSAQLPPSKVIVPQFRCLVHAALCLALSENPPVALACWTDFAELCGGGSA
jgi:hypothetical protein